MYPNRPVWAEVDLDAVLDNLRRIRHRVGSAVRVMAVVKSDAYGHGKLEVVEKLHRYCDWLGVSFIDEGVELRQAGYDLPILCLVSPLPDELDALIKYELTPVISDLSLGRALSERLEFQGRAPVKVHLKIDTGMGRLGVWHTDAAGLAAELAALPKIELGGMMTHFPLADGADKSFAREQVRRFAAVIDAVRERGLQPGICHAANTAAVLELPESHFDMVRPGLALYGSYPSPHVGREIGLETAIALRARLAVVKRLPAGTTISYGRRYRLERDTTVGVLPLGYADGWHRGMTGRARAIVRGQRRPIIGVICMDMSMIDLGGLEDVRAGEVVTLMGRDYSGELISVEEVAEWMDTIPYEVTCALSERVPRHYLGSG